MGAPKTKDMMSPNATRRIPEKHQKSLDTRLQWLWNQKFSMVQTIYTKSEDILDHTAATMILQCVIGEDLVSINMLFQRLEGGPLTDQEAEHRLEGMRI